MDILSVLPLLVLIYLINKELIKCGIVKLVLTFTGLLSLLGEQVITNSEIYADGSANDALPFGYQERYAEYRYKPSEILGSFMSTSVTPLDVWHLAQDFATLPVLNDAFIQSATPVDRVIAVPSEPHFLWDGYFQLTCARPMPTYSVPGYIDHF